VDKLLKGAVAGFLGTAPMTAFMIIGWRLLPAREKYPLPPRQITEEVTELLGIEAEMSDGALAATTLISHFSYGAMAGAVYGLSSERVPLQPSIKGPLAGFVVWAGSYLGLIPALGILSPATRHPWRRNLLMILAHFVWGATMAMIFKKWLFRN
jgi:putative membrane protein